MELWDAYDKDGNLTGQTLVRGDPVPDGLYHLVCDVLVRHTDGTFLLMQRDPNKETWPGVFEATAGGSAVQGEEPLEAARRELYEETGISRGTFSPLFCDVGRHAIYRGYLCETDWPKDQITLQEGETVSYRWVTMDEMRQLMEIRPHKIVIQPGVQAWMNGAEAPVYPQSSKIQWATRTLEADGVIAHKGTRRPVWHLAPQANWMNDPNGLIYSGGKYHAFWQCNPFAPKWDTMHWAHAVSADLIHWEYLPVALAPDQPYDDGAGGGCFSGSAIEKDGKILLLYTGVKDGRQHQCLAMSDDGIHFDKYVGNPVIPAPPEGHSSDFRDPCIVEHDGSYYLIVGSSIGGANEGGEGCVLCYRSPDLVNWTYLGIAARSGGQYGTMWECPDLFRLGGKWVLGFCPMYMGETITCYFVGKMDFETGVFTKEAEGTFDMGWEYYAPQTFRHTGSRRIQMGWQGHWDWMPFACAPDTMAEGWRWSMALPRELWLDETLRIRQKPVDAILQEAPLNGAYMHTMTVDGCVTLWPRGTEGEHMYIRVDAPAHRLEIARRLPSQAEWDVRTAQLVSAAPDLTIIADRHSVEVFADEGRLAFSSCDNLPGGGLIVKKDA
ncbi:MAG: NUDIX domain-containing protein [Clostridia bacterium]|nr:NUDIX domain-containing protein [Clostridia bacterium]